MTDELGADMAAFTRLQALPRVALFDWAGWAILVEAPTGIAYHFGMAWPGYGEPDMLVEGFYLPVTVHPADLQIGTMGYALDDVTYDHPASANPVHPVADPSRASRLTQALAVITLYGKGWLIWKEAGYVPGVLRDDFDDRLDRTSQV